MFDLEEPPETFGDWVDAMAVIVERDDLSVDLDLLCTTDGSAHAARFAGETQHYQCVLDAFIVPFLLDGSDPVEVSTSDPVTGEGIELVVSEHGLEVAPDGAVMSFGAERDAGRPPEDVESPALAYGRVCPYGKAFVSRETYREWAADVDAETMATTMEEAHRLAAALARVGGDV